MDHFAGLDVSDKETSVCIVDDTGKIVREVKVASEPEALLQVLGSPVYHFKRIGLEARATVAMDLQRSRGRVLVDNLFRDAAHGLKAFDPKRPIREADNPITAMNVVFQG